MKKIVFIFSLIVSVSSQNRYEFVSYGSDEYSTFYGSALQSADLDGDGDVDIAMLQKDFDRVMWLENDGNFSFKRHILSGCPASKESICDQGSANYTHDNPLTIAVGDWNNYNYDLGDSLVIIVMDNSTRGTSPFRIYAWRLTGVLQPFSPAIENSTNKQQGDGYLQRLYVDDVNNNGIDDIFYTTNLNLQYTLDWKENYKITNTPLVREFRISDFDKDGDLDWLGTFNSGNGFLTLGIWKNNGDLTFSSTPDTLLNGRLQEYTGQSFDLADFDKDGDIDIVFGGLKWAQNNNNVFTIHDLGNYSGTKYIEVVDADEDGDMDFVAAGNSIWLFTNDGNESEPTFGIDTLGKGEHFDIIDFDKDGDIDIVSSEGWYKFDSKPTQFAWVEKDKTSQLINVNKNNLNDNLTIKWTSSVDRDSQNEVKYKFYLDNKLHNELSDTSYSIKYQTLLDTLSNYPNKYMKAFSFDVWVHSGSDSVKIKDEPLTVLVNAFGYYLSTETETIPTEFALHENYPNPFNPTTTLRFDLPELSDVNVIIYNMLGQKVRTFDYQNTSAGYHSVTWNATNDLGEQVGAGVYLYQLQAKDFVKTRKMVLLK